ADRGLIPNLVEETVRFDPPITALPRRARSDTTLDGDGIADGETVLVHLGAANRDPAVFDDPDRFDVDRDAAHAHIGFGYGPHTCVGAPLARAEMAIGLDVLLDRMPELRLSAGRDTGQIGFFLIRGPSSLWVESV
ncbi:MAG: cytochrome P450, partial [Actinomycetota bacterium]